MSFPLAIPPPWLITIWTVPKDNMNPAEHTAGYFSLRADKIDFPDGGVAFSSEYGHFYFVRQAMGPLEQLADGGIQFAYVNLQTVPEAFLKPVIITVTRGDEY